MLKPQIVSELGEQALLLPELVNRGLAGNDRVKYLFSLLQTALQQARDPHTAYPDLQTERLASGLDDATLDAVVAGSRADGAADVVIPGAAAIFAYIRACMADMLAPLEVSGAAEYEDCNARLEALLGQAPVFDNDKVPADLIMRMTSAQRAAGDSLHLLVMDLHKALNALQASLAVESIDGAMVYGLEAGDRELVAAFMRGVNATAPLKFDHPGLGTTATRSGGSLVIQNDIGTTDAHVLVVRVTGNEVTVTYTDVHPRRLAFFQHLFDRWEVSWDTPRTRHSKALAEGAAFYGTIGRYSGADAGRTAACLEFLGSRLVFLIDWNKARKRLRNLVKNRDAIAVLKWAADNDFGHRAFLELGAEQLVRSAIEQALPGRSQYGQTLYDILEPEAAGAFLQFALRCASEGLREGRPARSVRDELRTELLEHVTSVEQTYLALLAEHAALVAELAAGVRDGIARAYTDAAGDYLARAARRAKRWESQADRIVLRVREMDSRVATEDRYADLCHVLDEVADELEDAAHLLTMMPTVARLDAVEWALSQLAEKVVAGAHTLVSALECMGQLRQGGPRQDMHDFLAMVDRLEAIEHDTDELERRITTTLVGAAAHAGQLHLFSLVTQRLETAADWMARSGWQLRERVLR